MLRSKESCSKWKCNYKTIW